jgi:hypothetical protein
MEIRLAKWAEDFRASEVTSKKNYFKNSALNCLNQLYLKNNRGLDEELPMSYIPNCRGLTVEEQAEK